MPTYEYKCPLCDLLFEWRYTGTVRHSMDCPRPGCGSIGTLKISGGSGFSFNQPDGVDKPTNTRKRR